jgi:GTP:adenosylcobinamide-phosphate guanylyltransferase
MDAVIMAGGIPQPGEPLYEATQGLSKALLDIAGKPMIQWVVDALEGAASVQNVVIIGLNEDEFPAGGKVRARLPNQGEMFKNIHTGITKLLEINPTAEYVLLVSSDIPAITPAMVDWVTQAAIASDGDVCYNIITRETMETRFPTSRRTYMRLKEQEFCGGDMNVGRTRLIATHNDLWDKLIAARKNPLKQASLFGLDAVLLLLLRQLSLEGAAQRISKNMGLKARGIICPYAEVGMDVDKPHQLELMRADMAQKYGPGK